MCIRWLAAGQAVWTRKWNVYRLSAVISAARYKDCRRTTANWGSVAYCSCNTVSLYIALMLLLGCGEDLLQKPRCFTFGRSGLLQRHYGWLVWFNKYGSRGLHRCCPLPNYKFVSDFCWTISVELSQITRTCCWYSAKLMLCVVYFFRSLSQLLQASGRTSLFESLWSSHPYCFLIMSHFDFPFLSLSK